MEPIFTFKALHHECWLFQIFMRLPAVAIWVKEILVVLVSFIFIVFLIIKRASFRHSPISTVTSKVSFRIKLHYFMVLVTMKHATKAKATWLNKFYKVSVWLNLQSLLSSFLIEIVNFFLIACHTGVYLLINVAFIIPTFFR